MLSFSQRYMFFLVLQIKKKKKDISAYFFVEKSGNIYRGLPGFSQIKLKIKTDIKLYYSSTKLSARTSLYTSSILDFDIKPR
jgi:hypothetical protein